MSTRRIMLFQMVILCLIYLADISALLFFTNVSYSGYEKWKPAGNGREDLFCPDCCVDDRHPERCCSCNSKACWEIDQDACGVVVGMLHIEYTDIFGSSVIVANSSENASIYELNHANGKLTRLSDNICDWKDTLFIVDLRSNRIANISDIRCLIYLDMLHLDNNKITQISNDTFSHFEQLRVLTLSHNLIEKLDPYTIKVKNGNIFKTDLSYNEIEVIDITNVVRPGPFCNLSYEGCSIKTQTNVLNFELQENEIYGPGDAYFINTESYNWLNVTGLGVKDYRDIPKYFSGTLHYGANTIQCDCNLFPLFAGVSREEVLDIWPELDHDEIGKSDGFMCKSPKRMIGENLTSLLYSGDFDKLTCDISERCPAKNGFYCECIDYPSRGRVLVNCSGLGLTYLPNELPVGLWNNDAVELLVDNNHITNFENRDYLDRLILIDLNNNYISEISERVGYKAGSAEIRIENQILNNLPNSFQLLDPNKIHFGSHPIQCDCDNLWIGDWIRAFKAEGRLKCLVNNLIYAAEEITSDFLVCNEENEISVYIVGSVSLFVFVIVIIASSLLYYFRYEIYLLKRKFFRRVNDCSIEGYDVFISFYDDNESVFKWIGRELLPALKQNGYSIYVPWFDAQFGEQQDEVLVNTISISRTYIVFLCEGYLQEEKTISEFNTLWKNFVRDETKNIIVINFDLLCLDQIQDRRLKAFLRIVDDLNFSVTENKLFERLKKRLGGPKVVPPEPLDEDQLI